MECWFAIIRANETVRQDVELTITGMAGGSYTIQPFDTWQDTYFDAFSVECEEAQPCGISVPAFQADIALKIKQ